MIEIASSNQLDTHPLEVAEIAHRQLAGKAHLLASEEQRDEDMTRREAQAVGAGEMIVQP
ncbi:hypothetical protein AWL63_19500 [Sphingomonas panacis]|uniref:Uncharacterized protein n=1 Tax=Sphingomonas panacis TaxID=1560345 RepID=A0A1B3ZEE9_9SPHN|nr:hypothetical protein AWL63_19500 [Sphingomonas panacis]